MKRIKYIRKAYYNSVLYVPRKPKTLIERLREARNKINNSV